MNAALWGPAAMKLAINGETSGLGVSISETNFSSTKALIPMMRIFNSTFLLRLPVAVILLAHSLPSIFSGDVNDFGKLYLDQVGFAPVGLPLAWMIKLSHVAAAACLLLDKYVRPVGIITILVLVMGIILIHGKEGWFVVGYGRNGMEFSFLLIFVLLAIMFPDGFSKAKM